MKKSDFEWEELCTLLCLKGEINPNNLSQVKPQLTEKQIERLKLTDDKYTFDKVENRTYQFSVPTIESYQVYLGNLPKESICGTCTKIGFFKEICNTCRDIEIAQKETEARRRKRLQTDPNCPYKTIKEAKAAGWQEKRVGEYGPEQLTIRGHHLIKNPKRGLSRTEWKKRGFAIKPGEKPIGILHFNPGKSVSYEVFADYQVKSTHQDEIRAALKKIFKKCPDVQRFLYPENKNDLLIFGDYLEDHGDSMMTVVREFAHRW